MAESKRHRELKRKAAGPKGRTEVPIRGYILDAVTRRKATEVQLGCSIQALTRAARRLKVSGRPQKVLQVPQPCMAKAREAMRHVGVSGMVKNLSGTRRSYVPKRRAG
jgi:hypothetical protein